MNKKVYLYSTCLGSALIGKTIMNAVWLLKEAGYEIVFKKDQTCCGQPSYNSGYFEESKKIALFNANLFDKEYPILVPSGSCAGMMMSDYLELFDENDENYEKIKSFSSRVYELGEFLYKSLEIKDLGEPIEEECCGFGGTFAVKEPDVSNTMAMEKIKHIKETSCKYIVIGDGGCMMNIDGTIKRNNVDVKVIHLYDFLAKRMKGESL